MFPLSLVYPQNAFVPLSVPILSLFFHNDVNASPSSDKNTHPPSFNAYQASTTVAKQRGPAILPSYACSKKIGTRSRVHRSGVYQTLLSFGHLSDFDSMHGPAAISMTRYPKGKGGRALKRPFPSNYPRAPLKPKTREFSG